MTQADELASALLLTQAEAEYEEVRAAYHEDGDETVGPKLAELAAKFDAQRTAHLDRYGPAAPDDGDAVVVTLPVVESAAANLGLEE